MQALEKALRLPCSPPPLTIPSPSPLKPFGGKGSHARSFFMASWPRSQRAEDWVVWAEFLSLPVRSLQLVNMKPGAGRIWPLSCQQSAHLESHKVVLGAPRSWAQGLPPPTLMGVGLPLPGPPLEPPGPVFPPRCRHSLCLGFFCVQRTQCTSRLRGRDGEVHAPRGQGSWQASGGLSEPQRGPAPGFLPRTAKPPLFLIPFSVPGQNLPQGVQKIAVRARRWMPVKKELTFSLAQRQTNSMAGVGEGFLEEAGVWVRLGEYRVGESGDEWANGPAWGGGPLGAQGECAVSGRGQGDRTLSLGPQDLCSRGPALATERARCHLSHSLAMCPWTC